MINRILIRVKVVQMLYSYMLTKSEFKIEALPGNPTRDSSYAHKVYIDLLLLILKMSGYKLSPSDKKLLLSDAGGRNPFEKSLVAASLSKVTEVKELGVKHAKACERFNNCVQSVFDTLSSQAIVEEYFRKRNRTLDMDVTMWCVLLESVLKNNAELLEILRADEDFTNAGLERGFEMAISTLKNYSDTQTSLITAKRNLKASLDQGYLLYHALLWLPVALTDFREHALEEAKEKYLPTAEDLNPNLRYVENKFVSSIRTSPAMEKYFKENPFSLDQDYYLLKSLNDSILASDIYKKYMTGANPDFAEDAEFWREIFRHVIFPSDALAEALEAKSVFWNDDLVSIGTFVLKTIRKTVTSPEHTLDILPEFKDDEDEEFGEKLFTIAVNNFGQYRTMLNECINSNHWDPERLAFMDTVVIATALAEILHFPKIPLVVSVNEYIEIANYYGTPRSGQFVNGVLYAICNKLINDGQLDKHFTPSE